MRHFVKTIGVASGERRCLHERLGAASLELRALDFLFVFEMYLIEKFVTTDMTKAQRSQRRVLRPFVVPVVTN